MHTKLEFTNSKPTEFLHFPPTFSSDLYITPHHFIIMADNPNNNPNWDRVYFAITIDMAVRGNFVLGSGETEKEAIECALSNLRYLFKASEVTITENHTESIKRLKLNKGILCPSTVYGHMYNEVNLRYCDAKIHIYGKDRGYNGMSYVLSRKYSNFAEYCYYDESYYKSARRQMTVS